MSIVFVPEIAEASYTEIKRTGTTIANLPPVGSRIRATLGESALVGVVRSEETLRGELIYMTVDGSGIEGFRHMTLWLEVGWTFEILDTPEDAA